MRAISSVSHQLFCLPYAGGSARAYLPWVRYAPDHLAVLPVELPGRGERIRELPCAELAPLVDDLSGRVAAQVSGPFALFGHSVGAALAYEVCRALAGRHLLTAERLFVSAYRAPHLPLREQRIGHLPDSEFVTGIREIGGTSEEVLDEPELMRLVLPVLRADFLLSERYAPRRREPLAVPIRAYGGLVDPDVTVTELAAWRLHTRRSCEVRMFDGDHFFINTCSHQVLTAVAADLAGVVGHPTLTTGSAR